MNGRPTAAFIAVNTAFLWAATAVAAAQFWPVYQDAAFVVLVVVATVVGSAIAIVGALLRWPTAVVVLVSLVAFFALGVPLAVPSETIAGVLPSLEGERQLLVATALGWKQLLTITLPVGQYQALLVPAFVLVLSNGVLALTLAVRSRAGDLAALGPVVILVAGIAFGPDSAGFPRTIGLALLVSSLVWLAWRRWYRRRAAIARLTAATTDVGAAPRADHHRTFDARTFVTGIVILAVASVSAVVVSVAAAPAGARQVLRTAVEQQFDPQDYTSPLSGFRSYLEPDRADATIFSVRGLPDGALVRIATLDSYNGIVYSAGSPTIDDTSGSFTRVPFRVDQSAVEGTPVSADIMIGDYSGVWVPTVGQLESIDFTGARSSTLTDRFYYNDASGTAADIAGLESGDSYHLDAVIPAQPTSGELATERPGTALLPEVTNLPQELTAALAGYTANATTPGAKLAAMISALTTNGHISHGVSDDEPPSRSGHSADRLTTLLTDQRMIGDAEQFSVTAALMARQLGFPARVVFGFAPEVDANGVATVTGASVTAWIEVDTAEDGWVTIDPSPAAGPIPEEQPQDPQVVSRPPSIVQPPVDDPPSTEQQAPQQSSQEEPETVAPWVAVVQLIARILAWVVLALGVLVSPFLTVIAVKARRRSRRRWNGEPLERISNGWHEYRDSVIDHGVLTPASATRGEFAESAGHARAAVLAAVVDRAVFAPGETDDDEAERVWIAVDDLRFALDLGLTRRQRLATLISLRSFGSSRLARALIRRGGVE